MHDMPDQTNDPKKHFMHVIREFLAEEHGITDPQAARNLVDDLFEANWEIIASVVMNKVIESGGVDPALIAESNAKFFERT